MVDWLIVGAGFAGSVLAERLASRRNESVLVIDRRDHIGGNAHDHYDAAGLLVHRHGPHIFHTNARSVFDYLSAFTAWRPYEHRVLANVDGRLLPLPINLTTLNRLYGLALTPATIPAFLAARAIPVGEAANFEEAMLARIGRELYDLFFRGYTRKQWGLDPAQLDKSLAARVPVRHDGDDRYFTDHIQCMPADGYTRMFERMLSHRNITVELSTSYEAIKDRVRFRRLIYTGPIDGYFGYRFGRLPYRALRFEHRTFDTPDHQPAAVINFPGAEPYTRVTEHKKLTGQAHPKTTVTFEFPTETGEPYYPIPRAENWALYKRYAALAPTCDNVFFAGRLATYQYLNMDQVVGQALSLFRRIEADAGATST